MKMQEMKSSFDILTSEDRKNKLVTLSQLWFCMNFMSIVLSINLLLPKSDS